MVSLPLLLKKSIRAYCCERNVCTELNIWYNFFKVSEYYKGEITMTMVERIKELCSVNGDTIASLERQLGIGNGVIRRWDKVKPRTDLVVKIAEHFHVTAEYLYSGKNPESSFIPIDLKGKHIKLIPNNDEYEIKSEDLRLLSCFLDGFLKGKYHIVMSED